MTETDSTRGDSLYVFNLVCFCRCCCLFVVVHFIVYCCCVRVFAVNISRSLISVCFSNVVLLIKFSYVPLMTCIFNTKNRKGRGGGRI